MSKLILRPTLIVTVPQAAVLGFYGLVHLVIGGSDAMKIAYAVLAGLAFIIACILAGFDFVDTALPGYEREQLSMRIERERRASQLDAEIGIPRIGERR